MLENSMNQTSEVMTSGDCYRLIHRCLGDWIEGALCEGFVDDPLHASYATDLLTIAGLMRDIESHTPLKEKTND